VVIELGAMTKRTIDDMSFDLLAQGLRYGDLIPFLGAGASASAMDVAGDARQRNLPAGSELAQDLANFFKFPIEGVDLNLPLVASYGELVQAGRVPLKRRLRHHFFPNYQCGPLHKYLASIDNPLLILTTNYDDLIEKAFDEANKPYDLIVYTADGKELRGAVLVKRKRAGGTPRFEAVKRNELLVNLKKEDGGVSVIYKMHGHCDRDEPEDEIKNDHWLISEEDYTKYLAQIDEVLPPAIGTALRNKGFLFLGYSLRDWNFRVMLWKLQNDAAKRGMGRGRHSANVTGDDDSRSSLVSMAIQRRSAGPESEIWKAKKIELFNADINEVVERLKACQAD
jgi:SIR2-like domain